MPTGRCANPKPEPEPEPEPEPIATPTSAPAPTPDQVALQGRRAAAQPTAAAINATFAVLGLGGYGLLVQVWLNGSFNERAQGGWF